MLLGASQYSPAPGDPRQPGAALIIWLPLVAAILVLNVAALHLHIGSYLAAGASVVFAALAIRRCGFASGLSVVLLVSLFYGLSPAYDLFLDLGASFVDPGTYVGQFLPILLLYAAAMACGFELAHRAASASQQGRSRGASPRTGSIGWGPYVLLLALSAAYFLVATSRFGLFGGEFTRAEVYQQENLDLQIIRAGIVYGAFVGFQDLRRAAGDGRSAFVGMSAWLVALLSYAYIDIAVLGDRRILLSLLLAMFVATRPSPGKTLLCLLIAVPAAGLLWVYSYLRNVPIEAWLGILDQIEWRLALNIANGEFGGWTRIAADVLTRPFAEIWQPTVIQAPLALVPSAIYPDRPLAPSLWYVNTFDPGTADIGGGWGFSLPIEAFMNAWYAGPVLLGLAIGMLLGYCAVAGGIAQMLVVFVLCFSFRSDLVSLLQQGLLAAAFALAFWPARLLTSGR